MTSGIHHRTARRMKLSDTEDKAEWIVTVAAKLIRDEIREKKYDCKYYPIIQPMKILPL